MHKCIYYSKLVIQMRFILSCKMMHGTHVHMDLTYAPAAGFVQIQRALLAEGARVLTLKELTITFKCVQVYARDA